MRVVVPYSNLDGRVTQAIQQQGYYPELLDTSGDDFAYHDAIKRVWESGQTFAIVEHDILVPPGALASFAQCEMLWCAYPYITQYGRILAFGCTRFSEQILRENADLFSVGLTRDKCTWDVFDSQVNNELFRRGYSIHPHDGEARHLRYAVLGVGFVHESQVPVEFLLDLLRLWSEYPPARGAVVDGSDKMQIVKDFLTTPLDGLLLVDSARRFTPEDVWGLVQRGSDAAGDDGLLLLRRNVLERLAGAVEPTLENATRAGFSTNLPQRDVKGGLRAGIKRIMPYDQES